MNTMPKDATHVLLKTGRPYKADKSQVLMSTPRAGWIESGFRVDDLNCPVLFKRITK